MSGHPMPAPATTSPPLVVLVDVYHIFSDRAHITNRPYLPLGLGYLTGSLKRAGVRVLSRHLHVDDINEFVGEVSSLKPLFVGVVNVLVGRKLSHSAALSRAIRNALPDAPIVWGGYFPTAAPVICLADGQADLIALGQGEDLITQLMAHFQGSLPRESLDGVAWLEDGRLRQTQPKPLSKPLDDYWPDFDFLDVGDYVSSHKGLPALQNGLITSRGCPFRCSFCCHAAIKNEPWRAHSADYVERLAQELRSRANFHYISLADDNFGANRGHMFEALAALRRAGVKPMSITLRVKDLNDDDVRQLNEHGIEAVFFGAESFVPRKLRLFNKQHSVEDITQGLLRLGRVERPAVNSNIIIAAPTETREEMLRDLSLAFGKSRFPGRVVMSFSLFFPLPATPMLRTAVEQGFREPKTLEDWSRIDNENIWDIFPQWLPWITEADLGKLRLAWRYATEILYFPDLGSWPAWLRWPVYAAVWPVFALARWRLRRWRFAGHRMDFLYLRLLYWFWNRMAGTIRSPK